MLVNDTFINGHTIRQKMPYMIVKFVNHSLLFHQKKLCLAKNNFSYAHTQSQSDVYAFKSFKFLASYVQGQNGSHFEPRPVPPPLPNKCDWEIDPSELDFTNSHLIGKVWFHLLKPYSLNVQTVKSE